MKQQIITLLSFLLTFSSLIAQPSSRGIIPIPVEEHYYEQRFTFPDHPTFCLEDRQAKVALQQLALYLESAVNMQLKKSSHAADATLLFKKNESLLAESYKLTINSYQIIIEAADVSGYIYAVQSLRQLMPVEMECRSGCSALKVELPTATISDAPRFGYRGLMLDVSRYFIPKANVLKIIDAMALMKLNKLHLHLVDCNGWRIEIKKYPKLTSVGAWRAPRVEDYAQRREQQPDENCTEGGFYTQKDIREMVAYASVRGIEIIPEIEMPAHTTSSLAAYPELACPHVDTPITVLTGMGGTLPDLVYCAGNEKVFSFLENVIDEIATLFPSNYIHLGGDEASKRYWSTCPLCKERMVKENISEVEELQSYFMRRMARYVQQKGKTPMGWDELTNSTLPDDVVIYGWQGVGNAALKAAKQGHRFILTPARALYLIRYQGPQWFEPRTYFGNNTLADVYNYEPVRPEWDPAWEHLLMGIQGSLWSEFCSNPTDPEYLIFPRIIAIAERSWSSKTRCNWSSFLQRLDAFLPRLEAMEVTYARSMFNLDHQLSPSDGSVVLTLSSIRPDMEIRYTTDGAVPNSSSILYDQPILLTQSTTIKAATFQKGVQKGELLVLPVAFNKATGRKVLGTSAEGSRLTNGLRGSDKHTDFEWYGWYGTDGSFVVDLGVIQTVTRCQLGTITNYGMCVHPPRKVQLFLSDDNITYHSIGEQTLSQEQIFKEGIHLNTLVIDGLKGKGRYLKISFEQPGLTPSTHNRPKQKVWVHFDEVMVE